MHERRKARAKTLIDSTYQLAEVAGYLFEQSHDTAVAVEHDSRRKTDIPPKSAGACEWCAIATGRGCAVSKASRANVFPDRGKPSMTISVSFPIGVWRIAPSRIIRLSIVRSNPNRLRPISQIGNRLSGINIAGYCARNDQPSLFKLRNVINSFRKSPLPISGAG